MARYIDADKVMEEIERIGGHNLCDWSTLGVKALIDRQPTADVVPKSEVEKLQAEAENLRNANADLALALLYECEPTKEHLSELEKAVREKIARDIFEEIYEIMNSVYASVQRSCVGMHGDNPETMRLLGKLDGVKRLGDEIAEIKKKYTEGEG